MRLTKEVLKIDAEKVKNKICRLISEYIEKSGASGAVVCLSGGVDSSLTCFLTAEALGADRVFGLALPERGVTEERDVNDALRVAKILGVRCDVIDITDIVGAFYRAIPVYESGDLVSGGNVKARVRMTVAYYYANRFNLIVVGSGNKSELMVGYFTKYGDGGVDILPIGDLYKTQVRQLALHVGVPEDIVWKTPSAGLWVGQTDEGELGVTYDVLDLMLYGFEHGMTAEEIAGELRVPVGKVLEVLDRVRKSEHKRRPPVIFKI